MSESKHIPEPKSYEEMVEFWDTHSLADYWDHTEPAEFDVSKHARRRYLVPVDRDLLVRMQRVARSRGLSTETLANLLIEQRLEDIEGLRKQK
jgi:hypothetical protein